jgi:predicted phage replisome organizer
MADVKWIKLMVDMFNHRKIEQLEVMPDGDGLIVIWLKLLCLAGSINEEGAILFTSEVPYTDEMLATHFHRPLQLVKLALTIFQRFGMIEIIDDIIHVRNWEKYQNTATLEKIREDTRLRVARHRNKGRLTDGNVTCNVTDRYSNATEEEEEEEQEEDKDTRRKKNTRADKSAGTPDCFSDFWSAYPKKVAKTTAQTAFKKLNPDAAMMETILKALEKQKKSMQWTKDNGQFIPNPSTWLNQKRWEDDIPEVVNGQPGSRVQGSDRAGAGTNGNRFAKLGDPI